jgi:hypothetical protein
MTDQNDASGNNDGGIDGINREARLANLLSNRATGFDMQPTAVNVTTPQAHIRYESHSNEIVNLDTGERFNADELPAPSLSDTHRIPDDGTRSIQGTFDNMQRTMDSYSARLSAHSFNPSTGEKVYAITGAEREQLLKEAKAFEVTFRDEVVILNRLHAQREADKEAQRLAWIDAQAVEARLVERAAEKAFEIEAEERARALIAAKRNRQG